MEPSSTGTVAVEGEPNTSIPVPSSMDPGTVEAAQDGMTLEPMYKELLSTSGDINQAPFLEPALGMTFDSYKEAEQFYNTYARHVGFGTRIKCTSRSKVTNETNRVVICCNKEGFKPTRKITTFSKPITRIGCMARMRVVKQNSSRKWVVTDLHLPHNHVCSPHMARFYRSHKRLEPGGAVFMQFQEEIYGTFNCYNIEHTRTGAQLAIYTLKERIFDKHGNMTGVKDYEVLSNEAEIEFQCICRLFQYKGILCRHVLYVLNHLGVNEIPNRYIITRWRKDFKRIHALHTRSNGVMPTDALQGYDDLYQRFIHLVEEGSLSADRYELAVKGMTDLMDKILAVGEDVSKSYAKGGKSHNAGDADTTNKSKRIKNPGVNTTPVMNPYVVRDPSKAWQQGHTKGGRHKSGELGPTNKKR
ncbi:FAR1-RELATED SEQUENCE 6 protein [Nymphaea thermarum]|nr:FAR1-RELATED SEQUENCE 6 protein [Nymphaea thermarum]